MSALSFTDSSFSIAELKGQNLSHLQKKCVQLKNAYFKRQATAFLTHRALSSLPAADLVDRAGKEHLGIIQQTHLIALIHVWTSGFCPNAI